MYLHVITFGNYGIHLKNCQIIITPLKFTSSMAMSDDAMSLFAHAIFFIPQVKKEKQLTPID